MHASRDAQVRRPDRRAGGRFTRVPRVASADACDAQSAIEVWSALACGKAVDLTLAHFGLHCHWPLAKNGLAHVILLTTLGIPWISTVALLARNESTSKSGRTRGRTTARLKPAGRVGSNERGEKMRLPSPPAGTCTSAQACPRPAATSVLVSLCPMCGPEEAA